MQKEDILRKLKDASEAYYNNQEEILSDEEYDNLMLYAESKGWLKQDSELNDGAQINITNEVSHEIPMLSLKKAQDKDTIKKYVEHTSRHGAKSYRIEPKLDGLALEIFYSNNKLILSTRGNGVLGEDVSYLLNDKKLQISNLPTEKPKGIKIIRGELFCSKEDLEYNNSQKTEKFFKNERSAASGIVRKSALGLDTNSKLNFIAYFAINEDNNFTNIPENILSAKDIFPKNIAYTFEELSFNIDQARIWRNEINIPTDGVVIKPNELIKIGNTESHPQEYIAYKYPGVQKETIVEDITITIGRTGKVTPNIKVKPIDVDGITISNVTGNNFDWLKERNVSVGAKVLVTRANDVIPKITATIEKSSKELVIPQSCPYCNSRLDYKRNKNSNLSVDLFCLNSNCPSRQIYELKTLVSKKYLDIDGMSEDLIRSLDITNIIELLSIKLEELKDVKYISSGVTLGEKRATQIIKNIENAKNNLEEYKWFMCLGFTKLGPSYSKKIINEVNGIDNFFKNKEDTINSIKKINGIGESLIEIISSNFDYAKEIYESLLNIGVKINKSEQMKIVGTYSQTGKVPSDFKNRDELVSYLASLGWEFKSSVNKDTQYLIVNDTSKITSKLEKALKLNVVLITWDDFKKML